MNEAGFKAKLRANLIGKVHIQSMASPGIGGTPDLWVSGPKGDLWIEVKFNPVTKGPINPKLSALQREWCNRRVNEGRTVMVLVGVAPSSGLIYLQGAWETPHNDRISFAEIITTILGITHA